MTRPDDAKEAIFLQADMPEDMQQRAVEFAQEALEQLTVHTDIADSLKMAFNKEYSPTWHCYVGSNFGK